MAGHFIAVYILLAISCNINITSALKTEDESSMTGADTNSDPVIWNEVYDSKFKLAGKHLESSFRRMKNMITQRFDREFTDEDGKLKPFSSDDSAQDSTATEAVLQLVSVMQRLRRNAAEISSTYADSQAQCSSKLENKTLGHSHQLGRSVDVLITLSDRVIQLNRTVTGISGSLSRTTIPSITPSTITEGTIRLVNGSTAFEGRLEIYHSGEWGTVCDDGWQLYGDQNVAVVCKELGYSGGGKWQNTVLYGEGEGPIWMDDVNCGQNATSLVDCKFSGWDTHDCKHTEDVSVRCDPLVSTTSTSTLSSTTFYKVNEESLSTASPTQSTPAPVEGDVRLIGGPSYSEGVLEIYHNGEWGGVCNDDWFEETSTVVVCHQLGFKGGQRPSTRYNELTSGPYRIDDVICKGTEERLADCRYSERYDFPCYEKDNGQVAAVCDTPGEQPGTEGDVRLLGGPSDSEGRLEIYHNGHWGVVCDTKWNYTTNSVVVCRQLGYSGGEWPGTWYGTSAGQYWINSVSCKGTEDRLADCKYTVSFDQNCDAIGRLHLSMKCDRNGEPSTSTAPDPGQTTSTTPSSTALDFPLPDNIQLVRSPRDTITLTWDQPDYYMDIQGLGIYFTTVADTPINQWKYIEEAGKRTKVTVTGLDPEHSYSIRVQAIYEQGLSALSGILEVSHKDGTTSTSTSPSTTFYKVNEESLSTASPAAVEGDIRLIGGPSHSEGVLEIYHNGQWGGVCDDDWYEETNTAVVCHQLGFKGGQWPSTRYDESHSSSYRIDDVICEGTEERLADCRYSERYDETCYDKDNGQVSVVCDTFGEHPGNEGDVRLIGGPSDSEGRLEIYHNGQWGVVCDGNWNYTTNAVVVCRQLGYSGGEWPGTWYGTSSSYFWIHDVSCKGTEDRLVDCKYMETYNQNCNDRNRYHLSVKCDRGGEPSTSAAPDSGQTTSTTAAPTGQDFPLPDNIQLVRSPRDTITLTWEQPDYYMDIQGLGIYYTTVVDAPLNKWEQMEITGKSKEVTVKGLDPEHSYSIRVQAIYEQGLSALSGMLEVSNKGNVRLVNGITPHEGRVEAYLDQAWVHVCVEHWDVRDAVVVCRELGYSGGDPVLGSHFGKGYSSMVLVNVSCTGQEGRLEDCQFGVMKTTDCGRAETASVRCEPLTSETLNVNTGETESDEICDLIEVDNCSKHIAHIRHLLTGAGRIGVTICQQTYPSFVSCLHNLPQRCKSEDSYGSLQLMGRYFHQKCFQL